MPGCCSYATMIKGFLENNGVSRAAEILHEMVHKGFSTDVSTAATVVDLLISDLTGESFCALVQKR
ncbi:Uncharacterized protein TCM_025171 [Theobroma cacao]|uniref:Pentatricopeptide repeat-containing protein n=1 Tax=Theobroma cacao TaxID=3641 RepID=A0A061F5J9_THECC|nr:Uncharacterized protein TCM_025171 [Theobroma cacao]